MSALTLKEHEVDREHRSGLPICCAAIASLLGGMFLASTSLRMFGTVLTSGGVIAVSAMLMHGILCRRDVSVAGAADSKNPATRSPDQAWLHCFWSVCALVVLLFVDRV